MALKRAQEQTQTIADMITSGTLSSIRPKRHTTPKRLHNLDTNEEFNKCFPRKTRKVEIKAFQVSLFYIILQCK